LRVEDVEDDFFFTPQKVPTKLGEKLSQLLKQRCFNIASNMSGNTRELLCVRVSLPLSESPPPVPEDGMLDIFCALSLSSSLAKSVESVVLRFEIKRKSAGEYIFCFLSLVIFLVLLFQVVSAPSSRC